MAAEDSYKRLLNTLGGVAGLAAALAALVYGTGALVLMLRLGLRRLPSTTAVPQLPREFLVSVGLDLLLAALLAAVVVLAVARLRRARVRRALAWAAAAALLCYLGVGAYLVAKAPFPAKACLSGGGELAGVLIGESGSRTYLGDLSSRRPRRIVAIPAGRVEELFIGGDEAQIAGVACPAHRA